MRNTVPCYICGEEDPIVKEFHHINPEEKLFNVGNSWTNRGMETIQAEIAKCVVLCANCHKRVEAGVITIDRVAEASS